MEIRIGSPLHHVVPEFKHWLAGLEASIFPGEYLTDPYFLFLNPHLPYLVCIIITNILQIKEKPTKTENPKWQSCLALRSTFCTANLWWSKTVSPSGEATQVRISKDPNGKFLFCFVLMA